MHRGDEDRLLVEDPSLPGGRLILTSSHLETWLSENLDQRCSVRLRRLRYKPGTSVTLGFDLTVERDGVEGHRTVPGEDLCQPCVRSRWRRP